MNMRGFRYSILFSILIFSCSTEDTSLTHSEVRYINNLIYSKSDTTTPYTGLVKELNNIGNTEFSYNVEGGEIVGDVQFYDDRGEVRLPVSSNRLVERNNLVYMVNQEVPFNGCVIDTYLNGQYKYKYFLIDGLQTGLYKSWSNNGQVTGEYFSIEGNINGDYSEYWDNDTLRYGGEFLNNLRIGTHTSYYVSGGIDSLVEYDSLGVKDGLFQSFYKNGQTMFLGKYSKGIETGDYNYWRENGVLMVEGNYDKNGNRDGLEKHFETDGSVSIETLYKNGVRKRLRYYEGDELWLETTYRNGKKHITKHYPDNPNHLLHSMVKFENGDEGKGWREEYFSDGTLQERYQVDGISGFKKVGEFYQYKKDGSLWIKGEYTDNRQSGLWIWYDKDGKVTSMNNMDD